jgi:hypothetical protein
MIPGHAHDRGIKPPVGSEVSEFPGASTKGNLDLLIQHVPSPSATILVEGKDCAGYGDLLFKRGYQVIRGGLFGQPPRDPLFSGYDAVLLTPPLEDAVPLLSLLRRVRNSLKPDGLLTVTEQYYHPKHRLKTAGPQVSKKWVTGLYENGFSIQAKAGGTIIARKTSLFLHPYRQGDETQILEMFQEVFNTHRTMAHWHWKFRDNPFGAHKIVQAVAQDGTLAGHYSGYPVPFYAPAKQHESFTSLQIGDIMTRPEFRNAGLAKTSVLGRITDYFHHQFCMDQIPFMYGFVAGNHRKFGERFLHYQYLADIPYLVLDLDHREIRKPGRIKLMLCGVHIEEIQNITPDFDLFFKKAAKDYGLLVKRDAAYLKWRYMDCPDGGYRFFVVKRFGQMVGWSIFKKRRTVLQWGDALFLKEHLQWVELLLSEVTRNRFHSIQHIEAWFSKSPGWWSNMLLKIGFHTSAEPHGLVGGVTLFDSSIPFNFVEHNFYYTMGDSDLF